MDEMWLRKASLMVTSKVEALDLSDFRFRFNTSQSDVETPSNTRIRVYNLAPSTLNAIRDEYAEVVLQAGYADNFGVIFKGTIKQIGIGRESGTDTFVDILAADGDLPYNFGVVNTTLAAGSTPKQRLDAVIASMSKQGGSPGSAPASFTGGVLPRGKVLFGMSRDAMRHFATSNGCTWHIDNGEIHVLPMDGYLESEAVVLTSQTGLIGRPEQTVEGVKVRCLINPKIKVGTRIWIDNASINKTVAAESNPYMIAYNSYAVQMLATISADGLYRVMVAEFNGDSRGNDFYCDLVCLAMDPSTQKVMG